MGKILIGYVSGLHGLRGDLKIKCKFLEPELIFNKDMTIYLNNEKHTITNCKFYKGVYLCTIDNLKDINLVEKYKGYDVFVDREDIDLKDKTYLLEDLKNMIIVYNNQTYGYIKEIFNNNASWILGVSFDNKEYFIPLVDEYVINVDLENKEVICNDIRGFIL